MRNNTCCFTGHRKLPYGQKEHVLDRLRKTVSDLAEKGYRNFVTGGALGFDTLAAMAVIDEKKHYPDINLILMLPCLSQSAMWSSEDRDIYDGIKQRADSVTFVSKEYFRGCMHERNRRLVEASSLCICYMTSDKGGTAYTVQYAKKRGLDVINIAKESNNRPGI